MNYHSVGKELAENIQSPIGALLFSNTATQKKLGDARKINIMEGKIWNTSGRLPDN